MCFGKFRDFFLFRHVGRIIINLNWKLTVLNFNRIPFSWSARANTNNALQFKWKVHAKTANSNNFRILNSNPLTDIRRRKIESPCHASSVIQFSCSLCTNCKKSLGNVSITCGRQNRRPSRLLEWIPINFHVGVDMNYLYTDVILTCNDQIQSVLELQYIPQKLFNVQGIIKLQTYIYYTCLKIYKILYSEL